MSRNSKEIYCDQKYDREVDYVSNRLLDQSDVESCAIK